MEMSDWPAFPPDGIMEGCGGPVLKQRREAGDVLPKPISGRPSKKYVPLKAGLMAQLEAHRDVTLEEHCCLWEAAHGMQVSTTTMSRAIRRVGWTRK